MRRRLVWVQYRKLLQTTLIGAVETVFAGIADTVLAGHLFGDDALAGVNLVAPAASFVLFCSTLVTGGAMISRSIAVGKGDRKEMDCCCSTGLWASLAVAVGLGLMFLGTDACLAAMGVTGAARAMAADYCRGYWIVAVLTPFNFLAYDLCSTDGGHRCCRIASVSNIVLKLAAAIPLARTFGIAGLAFSTALGLAVSFVIMSFHLRSDANTLRFAGGFSLKAFLSGVRFSALDQLFLFGDALKMLAVNAFVISCLGERFLPVVSAFTAISTLQLIQYATAVSAQPLVDVYLGEGNNRRVKTVARMGIAVTFAYGLLPAAALLAFPDLVSSFIGLTDPGLLPCARTAVRIAAAFLPLSLVCGFMDSFYIYTERFALSVVLILMDGCIAPILLGVGLGWLFAANGLWFGMASASTIVLAAVVAFAYARSGNPYFLPSERDALTFVFDLELVEREINALSGRVMDILKQHGRYSGDAAKAPLVLEDALMHVRERNAGRRVLAEATLDLNDGVALTLRDNGEIFDLTDADAGVKSLRAYLVSNVMSSLRTKFYLVTMGENRSRFRFTEGSACAS